MEGVSYEQRENAGEEGSEGREGMRSINSYMVLPKERDPQGAKQ